MLDQDVAGLEVHLHADVDLTGQDEVDVDRVRGVHAGIVRLEHVEQAGDVPLDLAGRVGRVEVGGQGRGGRAETEEAEPEPAGRRERVRASARGLAVARAALARLREIRFGLEGWDEAETRRFAGLTSLICAVRDAGAVRTADAGRGEQDQAAFAAAAALVRSAGAATARIDHILRGFGLTFARYEVLLLLSWTRSGAMPLGRMRDRLLIHQAAVTNLVDRLEADGLVRRVPHARDRRTTLAEITSDGLKVVIPATRQIAAQLQLGISDEQAEEVFALVQKLRRSVGEIS